jgi:hypothetical protein
MKYNLSLSSQPFSPTIQIQQIFYDEATRGMLDPGFIPLDNSKNERPDWFEFWPIRNFLKNNELKPDVWYGFLSPKFKNKGGATAVHVKEVIHKIGADHDVIAISPGSDQIAYFKNVFEQGDRMHPGLLSASQQFADYAGLNLDVRDMVSFTANCCFSNYIIARREYWLEWLKLADQLFDFIESHHTLSSSSTSYGHGCAPMKAFIQERLCAFVLWMNKYRVFAPPTYLQLIVYPEQIRRLLVACDVAKERFVFTGRPVFLDHYQEIRSELALDAETCRVKMR